GLRRPAGGARGGGAGRGGGARLVGRAQPVGGAVALRLRRDDLEVAPTGHGPRPGRRAGEGGGSAWPLPRGLAAALAVAGPRAGAVAVRGAALLLGWPLGRGARVPPPALAPFAWPALVVVHQLAGLPLALVLGWRSHASLAAASGFLGVVLAAVTLLGGAAVGP